MAGDDDDLLDAAIRGYYDADEEDARLFSRLGRLELARTQEIVARYLPPVELAILDVGGGVARQLSADDASFDAVLLFGPLYHLTDRADRRAALAEARRVLQPGGRLFA